MSAHNSSATLKINGFEIADVHIRFSAMLLPVLFHLAISV
jgi:hypothetical protein